MKTNTHTHKIIYLIPIFIYIEHITWQTKDGTQNNLFLVKTPHGFELKKTYSPRRRKLTVWLLAVSFFL